MTPPENIPEWERNAEVINDSLWYVNPQEVREYISQQREKERERLVERVEGMIIGDGKEIRHTEIGANWAFLKVIEMLKEENTLPE